MKRISKEALEQMIASGYDSKLLSESRQIFERGQEADRLLLQIESSFSDVLLGEGIGLKQAQNLSDFEESSICIKSRKTDEKLNWKNIPDALLVDCRDGLFFFDEAGIKFHLPAFLSSELSGYFEYRLVPNLVKNFGRFSNFTEDQKRAVGKCLRFFAQQPEHESDTELISRAVSHFWCRKE